MNRSAPKPCLLIATASRRLHQRIAAMLAGQGYVIQTAADSSEASRILLNDDPPDIALIDSALPGRNCISLVADVKRRSPTKPVWIIQLLTTNADPTTISHAAEAGIDDLLLCPGGDGPPEADLRIRLGVAAHVLDHIQCIEARSQAISLNSLRDSLTGVWSRESILSLLFTETDRVQRMDTPLGFMLLGVDNFSQINARHGHETGDAILQEVAVRLRRSMRSYDLIGRSGDDEFLIALPGRDADRARHLASRVCTIMLHTPFAACSGHIKVTVSIGLAQSCGRTPLVVLREAEQSLAAARREGRNCAREIAPTGQEQALLENHTA